MNLNKLLRSTILIGVFVVLLIPVIPPLAISSSMFFPFITGKNFAFRIIVDVMLGLWLVLAYRDKTARPKKSWILYSVTAYFAVLGIATIFGANPTRSFWSNFERMEGMLSYIHIYLYFLIASSVINTKRAWYWVLNAAAAVSVLVGFYGLLQFFGLAEIHQGATRLDSTLGNSAYLAVYMLFHIFILAYLYLTAASHRTYLKVVYGLAALFDAFILYYTATRGAILGLIGGVALALLLIAIWQKGKVRNYSLGFLALVVVLVGTFIGIRNIPAIKNNEVLGRFASISLTDTTTESRFMIWNMSWQGFKEKPILGWGPENYSLVFSKFYNPAMWPQEPWFDRSHDIIFDNLINAGILGLLAYLGIFAAAIYYLWTGSAKLKQNGDRQGIIIRSLLTGLLVGYFFQNIFVFDNITSYILFYSVLAFIQVEFAVPAVASNILAENKKLKEVKAEDDGIEILVIVAALVISISSIYYFSIRSIDVSQTLIHAITPSNSAETRLEYFKTVLAEKNVIGLTEAKEQLLQAAMNVMHDNTVSDDTKKAYFDLANSTMSDYFVHTPDDTRMMLFYASFLDSANQPAAAINVLEKARQLSPKKQPILFELGSAYLSAGDPTKSLETLKAAYDADPTYPEARKIYALIALYTHNEKLANQILGADKNTLINDDRFLNLFASQKRFDELVIIWKERQAANPKDKQINMSLAASYYYDGQKDLAVKTIEDYIKLDPSFATEGQTYINQVKNGQMPKL